MGGPVQGRDRRCLAEEPVVAARAHRGEAGADPGHADQVRGAGAQARGAAPAVGLGRRRAAQVGRRGPGAPPLGDREPRHGPTRPARARQLGRDAAEARRRARRHARVLRLPDPAERTRRRTAACCAPTSSSSCRAARPSSSTRRCRSRRTSTRSTPTMPRRSAATSHATPPRCATTSASSARSATGGSSSRRRSSSSCSSTKGSTAPRSTRTARSSKPAPRRA